MSSAARYGRRDEYVVSERMLFAAAVAACVAAAPFVVAALAVSIVESGVKAWRERRDG